MATTREMIQTPTREPAPAVFDVKRIREDFPILKQKVHGKPLSIGQRRHQPEACPGDGGDPDVFTRKTARTCIGAFTC